MIVGEPGDPPEVLELEAAAETRLRRVDADPSDTRSAAAAQRLRALAADLRNDLASPLLREYRAICGWLDEFDGMEEFALLAHEYRQAIGVTHDPHTADDYLRALIDLARRSVGAP
ncbi:MAG: hypothetical protein BGO51_02250 [Rhodospirillales bacterium 69-11]|jgi:hypothetical protein|nr:hypothetical protein [Rhodospirillales bacterium]MBN8904259.1 hypothetical protein [Rhodospirillales bacterium]MBN8925442.1 hypothetical protein [Rhodospirillales bacterium]OJW25413.1 MAG: hypothetical protein BGO51_02250 [Rhodospirillales bacterium 69-11]